MSDPSIKKRTKKRRKKAKGASGEAGAADSQPNGQEKVPKVSVMIGDQINFNNFTSLIVELSDDL